MPPGLPGALFVAVALTLPTTCLVLVQWLEHRSWRRGFWWRVGILQGMTGLAALLLLVRSVPGRLPPLNVSVGIDPTETKPPEHTDLTRGYHAGYALATDRNHRGSPRPKPEALTAMSNLRSRGEPPDFAEGFRRGYLAGLAGEEASR